MNDDTSLTMASRCDATASYAEQAFYRVIKYREDDTRMTLDLCGHHYRKHEEALVLDGWAVLDDAMGACNERPSISANAV